MPVLRLIRRAFCPDCFPWGLGNLCEVHDLMSSCERWAHKVAKLATPDQIIAENIVASFTKDLATNWTLHKRPTVTASINNPARDEWYKRWNKKGSKANYYMCNRVL